MSTQSVPFIHPEVGLRAHLVNTAESLIGKPKYCFFSENCRPPQTVNCGMFVRWVFAQQNFWPEDTDFGNTPPMNEQLLPALQNRGVITERPRPGDLVFIQPPNRKYQHVGILNFNDAVIHACWCRKTVVTDLIVTFCQDSVIKPLYVSLCEDSVCLTSYDIGPYLRRELSPEVISAIEAHARSCFDCDYNIEMIRRYTAWQKPQPTTT